MKEGFSGRRPAFIFLECAVEIVPEEIRRHPKIARSAARYSTRPDLMLLDRSIHHEAMLRLERSWKRGRPDILHTCLLVLEDSPLRAKGRMGVYFQSYDGRVFEVSSATRLPKTYERFKGVVASALTRERIVSEEGAPLIQKVANGLREFLSATGYELVLLWERGELIDVESLASTALREGSLIGIGCFPHGDFEEETLRLAKRRFSLLCGRSLTAWGTALRVLASLERVSGERCFEGG